MFFKEEILKISLESVMKTKSSFVLMRFINLIFILKLLHSFHSEKFWPRWELHILIPLSSFLCILFPKVFKENADSEVDISRLLTSTPSLLIWSINLNLLNCALTPSVKLLLNWWWIHLKEVESLIHALNNLKKKEIPFSTECKKEQSFSQILSILWLTQNVPKSKEQCTLSQK